MAESVLPKELVIEAHNRIHEVLGKFARSNNYDINFPEDGPNLGNNVCCTVYYCAHGDSSRLSTCLENWREIKGNIIWKRKYIFGPLCGTIKAKFIIDPQGVLYGDMVQSFFVEVSLVGLESGTVKTKVREHVESKLPPTEESRRVLEMVRDFSSFPSLWLNSIEHREDGGSVISLIANANPGAVLLERDLVRIRGHFLGKVEKIFCGAPGNIEVKFCLKRKKHFSSDVKKIGVEIHLNNLRAVAAA